MIKNLPDSKIIKALKKNEKNSSATLDYLQVLSQFADLISKEVRFISLLFPEYTPHDVDYHLNRLFYVADELLGEKLINNLNSSELLILSLSLYGHDWGMAVSEVEKEYIQTGNLRSGFSKGDYALLHNEESEFENYIDGLNKSKSDNISLFDWQEYVRNTHAIRSGQRIRNYFKNINRGLGEATAKTCEGHWLEFKSIEDNVLYPTNYSVSGEVVNLKALAVYVRLIDLLDISQDRTPYLIWKFVAPKNSRSYMEWQKHRSINSVTFSTYQDGRIIQVDGDTEDSDVYSSLIDLKNYCDQQLRGCNDVLNQIVMNFSKQGLKSLDLSRTEFIDRYDNWGRKLWNQYLKYIKAEYEREINDKSIADRLYAIAQLIYFNRIPVYDLIDIVTIEEWPIPMINKGGKFEVKTIGDLENEEIHFQPLFFFHFSKQLLTNYQYYKISKHILDKWKNESFVLYDNDESPDFFNKYSHQVKIILRLSKQIIDFTHELKYFRFLEPTKIGTPSLIQPIYLPRKIDNDESDVYVDIVDKAISDIESLQYNELNDLIEIINNKSDSNFRITMPLIGWFSSPNDFKFSYGYKVLNWLYPNSKFLVNIIAYISKRNISFNLLQVLVDTINELPFFNSNVSSGGLFLEDIDDVFLKLIEIIKQENLPIDFSKVTKVTFDLFVEDSIFEDYEVDRKLYDFYYKINTDSLDINPKCYKKIK
ncbi:hypothetical protein AAFN85_08105 [Mucilaginibacter sp. CAU 1740]|uniref:HD domain-containing protein n=1 Tax=Mucilaginibacter sp. CAU 1740 TaxID=3140365 RepID=UPI00325BEE96